MPPILTLIALLLIAAYPTSTGSTACAAELRPVTPVPKEVRERLHLDDFYKKHLSLDGFSILASDKVSDAALREAADILGHMLHGRPDLLKAIAANRVRLVVMSLEEMTTDVPEHSDLEPKKYWDRRARGLGATSARPAVSCGEENLLCCPGDPYPTENILVHEFAHVIHEMGMNTLDEKFDDQLQAVYKQALDDGLWKDTYAAENHYEYWAEGVQSYFDTNRESDRLHNHVDTREELREYDPRLFQLIESVLGENPWRYRPASERQDAPHLKDLDRSQLPRFEWPESAEAE